MQQHIKTPHGIAILTAFFLLAVILINSANQQIGQLSKFISLVNPPSQLAQVGSVGSITVFLTSGSTWTVPLDWNDSNNTIEAIGGGGGAVTKDGGGGGGAYSKIINAALTPGSTVGFNIGAGGNGASGGDSYFCSSSSNCSNMTGSAVVVGAKGGMISGSWAGGGGGSAAGGVGTTKYSGGNGGNPVYGVQGGGGGGGAAGPYGAGASGGNGGNYSMSAGGGGGGGGGSSGQDGAAASQGGNGGNNRSGSGGGTGGNGASGSAGTAGGGGGGGGGTWMAGGTGGTGNEWDGSHGSGGGGGGAGYADGAGTGGLYGGGAGGRGAQSTTNVSGAQGLIAITYTPVLGTGGASYSHINVSVSGSGTVTSSPAGISCGSTCSSAFTSGSSVALSAAPVSGYGFGGWSGGGCSGTGVCNVAMSSDMTVTATFTQNPPQASGNIYVADYAQGQDTGADCSDAHSAAWFNSASSWAVSAGHIGHGTTVHLCGTITTQLGVQGSGTSGSPITIYFEPNAKISLPACTGYNMGCLNLGANNYIIVDGGSDGIIENTQNGTGLANNVGSAGITLSGNNVTVENLTIRNIYVHNSLNDEGGQQTYCIYGGNGSNVLIKDNILHDARWCLIGISGSNTEISGNDIYNVDHGVVVGGTASNINIYGNHFHDYSNWDDLLSVLQFHHDAIHIWGTGASASVMSNVNIYDNLFDGQSGHTTSLIFAEPSQTVNGLSIYDNVAISSTADGNGVIGIAVNGTGLSIMNNTIIGVPPQGSVAGLCLEVNYNSNITIKNNVIAGCGILLGLASGATYSPENIDYNTYADFTYGTGWAGATTQQWYSKISDWQKAKGVDMHSIYSDSYGFLNGSGFPSAGSPTIGTGANLTSLCGSFPNLCKDYAGTSRPSTGPWDIGAYQYSSTPINNNPPAPITQTPASDTTPPSLTSITASSITTSGAVIAWTTNEGATTQVKYGLTTAYGSNTSLNSTLTTSHTTTLTNLSANTVYHYAVISTDGAGNTAISGDSTFSTLSNTVNTTAGNTGGTTGGTTGGGGNTAAGNSGGNSAPVNNPPANVTPFGGGLSSVPASAPQSSNCPAGLTCTPVSTSPTTNQPSSSFTTLTQGQSSPTIKTLQQTLNSKGYIVSSIGVGSKGNETTYFGSFTSAALKRYQCSILSICSGSSYGVLNQTTAQSLGIIAITNTQSTIANSQSTVSFTRGLTLGSQGSDVKALQVFLNTHGFTVASSGNGSSGHETTYFGPATRAALAKFQKVNGITPAVGYFGPITINVVNVMTK